MMLLTSGGGPWGPASERPTLVVGPGRRAAGLGSGRGRQAWPWLKVRDGPQGSASASEPLQLDLHLSIPSCPGCPGTLHTPPPHFSRPSKEALGPASRGGQDPASMVPTAALGGQR